MAIHQAMRRMKWEPILSEPATDLTPDAVREISGILRELLADVFTLYMKTKNFHWHVRGPQFREYHLLFDEHAESIFAMTDAIAERARKIGGTTLRSIGDILRHQTLPDNDQEFVTPWDMLKELRADNRELSTALRSIHQICARYRDFATASLTEKWIDETEERVWALTETARDY